MTRPRRLIWCLAAISAVGIGTALAYARLATPTYPAEYAKEVTATGLVERVRYLGLGKRHCAVEVATYAWINLSPGFPLQDIPQEGDRYTLFAPLDICRAAQAAAAAANGHILYKAGEGRAARWYLSARPEPGYSCGGIRDWQPPPRQQGF